MKALSGVTVLVSLLLSACVGTLAVSDQGGASGGQADSSDPAAFSGTPGDWAIDFQTLNVRNQQEDSFFSDGDEPYLVTMLFRSRFGTPNSTNVTWQLDQNDSWADEAEDGETFTIPNKMRRLNLSNVQPYTIGDYFAGLNPEIVGSVAVAIESDNTPWSSIRSLMNDLEASLETELAGIIETKSLSGVDAAELAGDIGDAVSRVKDSVEPGFWGKVGLFIGSAGDPDDVIGFDFRAYLPSEQGVWNVVRNELPADAPFGRLTPSSYDAQFRGDDAHYEVSVNVERN